MSDEEVQEEIATTEEEVAQTSPEEIAQPVEQSQQNEEKKKEKLNKKFRLIKGEEILETKQPSFLAFFQYYLLGVIVFESTSYTPLTTGKTLFHKTRGSLFPYLLI